MFIIIIFWSGEAAGRRKPASPLLFHTVLTLAFLCTGFCQPLDVHVKKKNKTSLSLNICANQLGGGLERRESVE